VTNVNKIRIRVKENNFGTKGMNGKSKYDFNLGPYITKKREIERKIYIEY
jgi:hypothetical protein